MKGDRDLIGVSPALSQKIEHGRISQSSGSGTPWKRQMPHNDTRQLRQAWPSPARSAPAGELDLQLAVAAFAARFVECFQPDIFLFQLGRFVVAVEFQLTAAASSGDRDVS